MVAETQLTPADLIAPLFVREGITEPQAIASLPGVVQHTRASMVAEAKELVAKVRARYGDSAIISNTVDAHYTVTRILIEAIRKAGSSEIEAFSAAMLDMPIMSGNGEVQIRSSDRHADLNVLIVGAKGGQMEVLKDIGRIDAPSQCS